jgi:hypothetical protein
MYGFMPLQT